LVVSHFGPFGCPLPGHRWQRIEFEDGGPPLLLLQDSFADAHVQDAVAQAREQEMAELERNVVDLNGMFQSLLSHVRQQGDTVDDIERNMDHAEAEVHAGVGHLLQARRYTTAAWPIAGALVGALIFGPVGLMLGAKVRACERVIAVSCIRLQCVIRLGCVWSMVLVCWAIVLVDP